MKIVEITEEQFNFFWMKSAPQARVNANIPVRNIVDYGRGMMFVIKDDVHKASFPSDFSPTSMLEFYRAASEA